MQKLIVASTELDLEKGVPIPFVFGIADVRDISKRSGGFSKSIALPGTNKNNAFFGGLYDFNADFSIFNPNIKTPCVYIDDNQEFINGFMQLKGVVRDDKKNINYNVVLYDSVVDFWKGLDKKKLGDLDYSELNHLYTKDNIIASWAHTFDDGYFYAMMFSYQQIIKTTDFRPAIFSRFLLDKIMTASGFTWGGNLKTNPIFEREIIQNSIDRPTISAAVASSKTFRVSKSVDELVSTETTSGIALNSGELAFNLDDETTAPNQDTNNLWAGNTFTAPLAGKYRVDLSKFRAQVEYDYTVAAVPPLFQDGSGQVDVKLRVNIKDDLGALVSTQQNDFFFSNEFLPRSLNTKTILSSEILFPVVSQNTADIYLGVDWTVEFVIEVTGSTLVKNQQQQILSQYTIDEVRVKTVNGAVVESLFIQYAYDDNTALVFEDFINIEFEQKKVIQDVINRYNCFVYPDPENPKNILFNIRDEFYATSPVLDWTSKKDFDTRDQIKVIGELQQEELLLSYTKGEDQTNKSYTDTIGDDNIYGQFEFTFGNEFVKGKKKIQSPYNPTPLVFHGFAPSHMVVPAIHAREPIVGMRVLYAAGVIETANSFFNFGFRDVAGNFTTQTILGYPYAGHYDHPFNPTIDINYGALPFPNIYYSPNQTTDNNVVNRHWKNTINQSVDGRLVISKFNLNSSDVHFIKNNPNTKLFVDNKFYFINKIDFEGNKKLRGLTKIELITVEDGLIIDTSQTPVVLTADPIPGFVGKRSASDTDNEVFEEEAPVSRSVVVAGIDNFVGKGAEKINIVGDGNFVDSNTSGVLIQGDGNKVFANNVTLVGVSGLTVRRDNVSIVNGCITQGCLDSVFFNKIDGGLDALRNLGAVSEINKVNGEIDGIFNLFTVSLFNKIDSDDGITDEI